MVVNEMKNNEKFYLLRRFIYKTVIIYKYN